MAIHSAVDKATMLTKLSEINRVEGFDPVPFAVDYTDLNTGETRKRLPVMIQMAWFRLKYPEGRIAVQVVPGKECFVATARIYPCYKDPPECYLAEATASRGPDVTKPSVSPREWAQTAAVGIALRNAGFGLQFNAAGDEFMDMALNELPMVSDVGQEDNLSEPEAQESTELSPEKKLSLAMQAPCPIAKYKGRTLGEVLTMDPNALNWVATKFTGDAVIAAAAKLICEHAMQESIV